MKKLPLFLLAFFCFALKGSSQVDIKLYSGLIDRFGIGVEPALGKNLGLEIGNSYRAKSWFLVQNDLSKYFINLKLKKYLGQKHPNHGFFYGGYLRYYLMKDDDFHCDTLFDEGSQNTERKISIGGLIGYKALLRNKFNIGFSLGLGISPRALYWYKTICPDGKILEGNVPDRPGNILGDFQLISNIGHFSIGYIIGAKDKYNLQHE